MPPPFVAQQDYPLILPWDRVIYNFPPVAGGIDLDSDDVAETARLAPNLCGIMLS